jgi:hypothetical protein
MVHFIIRFDAIAHIGNLRAGPCDAIGIAGPIRDRQFMGIASCRSPDMRGLVSLIP